MGQCLSNAAVYLITDVLLSKQVLTTFKNTIDWNQNMKRFLLTLAVIGFAQPSLSQENQDALVVCNQPLNEQNAAGVYQACSIVANTADAQLYRAHLQRAHTEKREKHLTDAQLHAHETTRLNIIRHRFVADYKRMVIVPEPYQKCWLSRRVVSDAKQLDLEDAHAGLAEAATNAQTLSDECDKEHHSRALLSEVDLLAEDGSSQTIQDALGWTYTHCLSPESSNPYYQLTVCRETLRHLGPWLDVQLQVRDAFPGNASIAAETAKLSEDLGLAHAKRAQILSIVSPADIPAICLSAEVAVLHFDSSGTPSYDVDWVRAVIRDTRNKHDECVNANSIP